MEKKIIYLDQKFWLSITKSACSDKAKEYESLLNTMRMKKDKFIAPLSAINLFEFKKIKDSCYLQQIRSIVNEFSDKKCFLPWFEIIHFCIINYAIDVWGVNCKKYDIKKESIDDQKFLLGRYTIDYSAWTKNYPDIAEQSIKEAESELNKYDIFDFLTVLLEEKNKEEGNKEEENKKWEKYFENKRETYNVTGMDEKSFLLNELPFLIVDIMRFFTKELGKFILEYNINEFKIREFFKKENLIKIPIIYNLLIWEAKEFRDKNRNHNFNDFYDQWHIITALALQADAFATEKHASFIAKQIDKSCNVFSNPNSLEEYIKFL